MIYILGASGHGRVVADLIESQGFQCSGFYDDAYSLNHEMHNRLVLLNTISSIQNINSSKQYHIAIGLNSIRKKIAEQKDQLNYPVLKHLSAVISKNTHIKDGTVCMAGSIIQTNVRIGKHCIINTNASVDHDCVLEDFSQVAPGAVICGNVVIGECSYVGAGAVIKQGIQIGKNVMIGAGSVVLKDVPENCMVFGNPAKIIKKGMFV
jgi:sugar O-acyltransferase (sialic acid O-acetyltransferase NeuD family)